MSPRALPLLRRTSLSALVTSVACSSPGPSERAAADASAEVGSTAAEADAPSADETGSSLSDFLPDYSDITCEPTFASIRENVFERSCGWDNCHHENSAAWGLRLTSPDELVGTPAASCSGWARVVPGSPERSFLWRKLTDAEPPCGERMPFRFEPLPTAALDCIEGWIESLGPDRG